MGDHGTRPSLGSVAFLGAAIFAGGYFTFASVQGDFGIHRRVQVEAEADALQREKARLEAEVSSLRNRTRRLGDGFLDLDLLDERARKVLGMARGDEVVLQ